MLFDYSRMKFIYFFKKTYFMKLIIYKWNVVKYGQRQYCNKNQTFNKWI